MQPSTNCRRHPLLTSSSSERRLTPQQEGTGKFAGGSITLWPLLAVMTTAFLVVLPFLFLGNPSGHDFEFHVNSWMEVLGQWKQGILYPRWAVLAQYGYGEARFIFYPPASWTLGAALGAILPWKIVPSAYVWIALTLSGCSMFFLARRWLERRDAIFAAAFYAANPYYLVIVYWRSAFAELLAGALLPLLLLYVLRSEDEGQEMVIPLALIVAAAWLTNIPAAVMINYSLVLLIVILAALKRSPRVLLHGAIAVLLGAALAAFFLLPAACERKWVNIGEVLSPGVRPRDNFLFTHIADVDHNRFNFLVSLVASAEMIVLAIAALFSRQWRHRERHAWWMLFGWAVAATLLNFSFTSFLWEHLPQLRYLQLPWRWLLCLNVSVALFLSMAWRRWIVRVLLCFSMFAVLVFVWQNVQPPWWELAADFGQMLRNQQSGSGYEGTDEYVPLNADPYQIKKDAPLVAFYDSAVPDQESQPRIQQWSAESKTFTIATSQPERLVLRLFNYPAWRVAVNGRAVATTTRDVTGQMLIPVQAGENQVQITFARTWDRTLGGIISSVSALFVGGFVFIRRRRSR
ncbi:MAG TPA: 6-pyruvoyl-tetrahydropterin synthase-related protein [Terriglobales bacterium]|nr:6-pyruvoyl-tetrahydropterin synthase-related protein [Terriglobales bacterium]